MERLLKQWVSINAVITCFQYVAKLALCLHSESTSKRVRFRRVQLSFLRNYRRRRCCGGRGCEWSPTAPCWDRSWSLSAWCSRSHRWLRYFAGWCHPSRPETVGLRFYGNRLGTVLHLWRRLLRRSSAVQHCVFQQKRILLWQNKINNGIVMY